MEFASPAISRVSNRPHHQPSVLVVDDDPGVRRLLDRALPLYGFRVRLAASGPEALDLFEAHRHDIDLVLLDVRMPQLDGPATLAALSQLDPGVRCVFMSGQPGDYTEDDLRERGAQALVPKPFKLDELGTRLRALVAA